MWRGFDAATAKDFLPTAQPATIMFTALTEACRPHWQSHAPSLKSTFSGLLHVRLVSGLLDRAT